MNLSKTPAHEDPRRLAEIDAVVIGCSAGGVDALTQIFSHLPPKFRVPIVVVLHVPPRASNFFASCFGHRTELKVREAEEKEVLTAGNIYFAPPDFHLLVEKDRTLSLNRDEAVNYSRPAIDVLFESAADAYGPKLIGLILSGSNSDGAMGLRGVEKRGGIAIVQDPKEAHFDEMPVSAIKLTDNAPVLSLQGIAKVLAELI